MEKKDRLEILVVEDTPENLAVAKGFFNSQPDLNTDYATCRDEALSMLDSKKYGGVITDKSMPAFLGDNKGFVDTYSQNNGWSVALQCELKEIPWVMHSEHGTSKFYFTKKEKNFPKELAEKIYNRFIIDSKIDDKKEFISSSIGTIYDAVSELGNISELQNEYDHRIGQAYNRWGEYEEALLEQHTTDLKKSNPESWKTALDYLKQRISK